MIYLSAFAISTALMYLGQKQKKRMMNRAFILASVLLLAVLAGCRSSEVGTDVLVYGRNNFIKALNSNSFISYYANYLKTFLSEPFYHLTIWISSRFSNNFHFGLFVMNAIYLMAFCLGIEKLSKIYGTDIILATVLYYLLSYNISLNIMRQMIAVSIVFLSFSYYIEKKNKTAILLLIIAIGFHSSAVFGACILAMYWILKENRTGVKETQQIYQGLIFLVGLIAFCFLFDKAITVLVSMGFLRKNYLNYLIGGKYESNSISLISICLYGIYFLISIILRKYIKNKKIDALFFTMICFSYLICSFSGLISLFLGRIGYYFIPFISVHMANTEKCFSKNSKWIWRVVVISIALISWLTIFVLRGNHQTIPYIFDLTP